VTDTINFRSKASFTGAVIAVARRTRRRGVGGPSNGFYKVEWSGQSGYMHADYLMWTDQELTVGDGGVGGPGDPDDGPPDDGDSTSMGRKMVDYAERYLGYPYVWATHGPRSFDCSGFTYWVTLKTAGIDIGAGTWSQSVAGRPVAYGSLQPGDLVFFQNTYTWGLSHVGLYIGGGQFIHAQNEQTGVVISSLDSAYYKTRWFGARRVI
jgi:cell wall-associated NlpC family hydrolase